MTESVCSLHRSRVTAYLAPYYVYRCRHRGELCVVETRRYPTFHPDDTGYFAVDYVARPGTGDVRVEAANATTEAEADRLWLALLERLDRGDPPRDERGLL